MPTGVRRISTGEELADRFDLKVIDQRTGEMGEGLPDLTPVAAAYGIPVDDLETFSIIDMSPRAGAVQPPPPPDPRTQEEKDIDAILDKARPSADDIETLAIFNAKRLRGK